MNYKKKKFSVKNNTKEIFVLLLNKNGYKDIKLSTIAKKLGIHRQTLLYHYKTKQDILDDITTELSFEFVNRIRSLFKSSSPNNNSIFLLTKNKIINYSDFISFVDNKKLTINTILSDSFLRDCFSRKFQQLIYDNDCFLTEKDSIDRNYISLLFSDLFIDTLSLIIKNKDVNIRKYYIDKMNEQILGLVHSFA